MTIRCIIIDDEQLARDMLAVYAQRIPELQVMATCKNAKEAKEALQTHTIDLMLLDIQMPNMTGTEFLRSLPKPPKVIFTTAYANYALEGYELEVTDYLLKPIGFTRFEKAILKVKDILTTEHSAQAFESQKDFDDEYITVKEAYNHHKVFLKDIICIIAQREYSQYHTSKGRIMELKSLSTIENELPKTHFIKIHRSSIIAKNAVVSHEKSSLLLVNEMRLSIGKTYKKGVLTWLFVE